MYKKQLKIGSIMKFKDLPINSKFLWVTQIKLDNFGIKIKEKDYYHIDWSKKDREDQPPDNVGCNFYKPVQFKGMNK